MFVALGYKLEETKARIIYIHETFYRSKVIFYKNHKEFSYSYSIIELDLLKAINQQCKELGWLDE